MPAYSPLCATCTKAFNTGTPKYCHAEHHATFDSFRQAAADGCYICSSIWNQDEQQRVAWARMSPEDWSPFRYAFYYPSSTGPDEIRLRISGDGPPDGLTVGFFSALISPNDSLHGHKFSFLDLDDNTSSSQALDLAYGWVTSCHASHSWCRRLAADGPAWQPTRLLDIGVDNDDTWRLRVVAEDEIDSSSGRYITLSYRWGTKPSIKLLGSNMDEFRKGKPISELPRTFRDLITVARRFSTRYIWIDAPCIVQDSKQDWDAESVTMRYDPDGGLFRDRNPESVRRPAYVSGTLAGEGLQDYYVVNVEYWDEYLYCGPLHKRGWVFQERFLAPGVLYFTKHQVLWECLTEHSCEGYPRGVPFLRSPKNFGALWPEGRQEEYGLFDHFKYQLWARLVATYSNCSFTKRTDMPVAFSGLAKLFQEHCKDEYVAGLWKSRLPEMLGWQTTSSGEPPAECLAPSWSWASVGGPVALSTPQGRCLVTLLDVETINRGPDPTSGVLYGRITLKGLLFPATYVRTGPPLMSLIRSLSAEMGCWLDFDSDEEPGTERPVFIMPISGFKVLQVLDGESHTPVWVSCLVLDKYPPDTPDTYRRIGRCTLTEEEDILQHHIDLDKEAAVVLRPGAPLTEINMV